ncbi:MAG: hypothetical protein JWN70_3084 [Planctomycetaceae bacterium]|nr:hypothetical protein [Planctomycetaceae bacterium]
MQLRTIGQISLIVVLSGLSGLGADTDPAFREAKQAFQVHIRRKAPADRVDAIAALAEFSKPETVDLILKKGVTDNDPQVRQAAQVALRKLAATQEIRDGLLEDFKRSLRKAVINESTAELLRPLVIIEDEAFQTTLLKLLDDYLASSKGNIALPMTLIDDFAKEGDAEAYRAVTFFSKSKAFEAKFGYRRCVVQALAQIRDPEAVTTLILLIPNTSGLIQHDIIQYLTKLTSQKFADNDREWFKWWKENKAEFKFPKAPLPTDDVPTGGEKLTYYGIPVCAKRIVFVLDTSGSMRGLPLDAAKNALLQVVENLPEPVHFDIVMFDRTVTVWQPRLMPATTQVKNEARVTVQNRAMGAGTVSFAAIEAAFKLEPEAIYFLSDGQPTDSQPDQIFNTFFALNRTRRVSIHTIGVVTERGNAADLILFMKPLAEKNFGSYRLVE